MRGDDPQRHADGDAHQGGEDDLGQGLHGFLPVAEVEDQQQGRGGEQREADAALDAMHQHDQQGDQHQRVEPQQAVGHAVDEELQGVRHFVEERGTVLGEPVDEGGDLVPEGKLVISQEHIASPSSA
ncbi:hypothetical protein D9M71_600020 [compost metagenome]